MAQIGVHSLVCWPFVSDCSHCNFYMETVGNWRINETNLLWDAEEPIVAHYLYFCGVYFQKQAGGNGGLCGNELPPVIYSTGPYLTIYFRWVLYYFVHRRSDLNIMKLTPKNNFSTNFIRQTELKGRNVRLWFWGFIVRNHIKTLKD